MEASERAFFGADGAGAGAIVAVEDDGAMGSDGGGGDGDAGEELVDVPLDTNTQLQLIFQYYCRFGRTAGGGEETDSIGEWA